MDPMNKESSGTTKFQCSTCCAPAGEQHAPGCAEAGLASAVRKALDLLAQVDVSKVPLGVPAAIGVLRSALDEHSRSAPAGSDRVRAPLTFSPCNARWVIVNLLAVATAAWHALDDSEELSDGTVRISPVDATALAGSLAVLDELPDDKPGYTLTGPGRAEWALRHVLVAAAVSEGTLAATVSFDISEAAGDVLAERRRQIEREGYDPAHDDGYPNDEIAAYAAFYAMPPAARDWPATETGYGDTWGEALIPAGWTQPKTGDRRRELVKAGALILAEVERIDRAAHRTAEGGAV